MRIFIIGAGEVGFHIASALVSERHDLIVIEADPDRAERLQTELDVMAIYADGSHTAVLREHGVEDADLVFAVSNSDAVNVLVALTARRLGAKKCVARLGDPSQGENPLLLEDPNVLLLYPEHLVAEEVLGLMRVPGASKALFFEHGKLVMLRARPSGNVDIYDRPLRELTWPEGWVLVGVERGMKLTIPHGNTVLKPGQRIYAVGRPKTAQEFLKTIGIEAPPIKRVVIAGAGGVGSYLAKKLVEEKIEVSVIQRHAKKARALATEVPEALVLQGDATDMAILKEAGVPDADYFVSATQDDETNVITSYLAHEAGARIIVTLYQRPEFVNVLRAARVDIGLSPRLITAGTILRMVRRREILSLDLIASGEAEVVEFQVPDNCRVLKGPLRRLKLPEGCIIGAVVRGNEHFVPAGNFEFEVGDRALVFSLVEALPALERLFRGK